MSIDEQTRGRIDALVREHRILLFMKGDPAGTLRSAASRLRWCRS